MPHDQRPAAREPLGRRQALWALAAVETWVVLVAVVVLVVVPVPPAPEAAAAVHVGSYVVAALPVVLARPQILCDFAARRGVVLVGGALLLAAIAYASLTSDRDAAALGLLVVRMAATAAAEELIFRGYLWDRTVELVGMSWRAVVLNVVLFTGSHVPLVLAQGNAVPTLAGVVVLGAVFCLARATTGTLAAPTFLHWAVDISGG